MTWKFWEKAKDESVFLSRLDDIVFVMAIELKLSVFESAGIDFGSIFECKLKIDCRISNIFDFDFFSFNVSKFDIKIKL